MSVTSVFVLISQSSSFGCLRSLLGLRRIVGAKNTSSGCQLSNRYNNSIDNWLPNLPKNKYMVYAFKLLNNATSIVNAHTPCPNNYQDQAGPYNHSLLNSGWKMRFSLLFQFLFLFIGIVFTILNIKSRFYTNKVNFKMTLSCKTFLGF